MTDPYQSLIYALSSPEKSAAVGVGQVLTRFLHKQATSRTFVGNLEGCVFVCAVCDGKYSQYVDLGTSFEPYHRSFEANVHAAPRNSIVTYGFRLGRLAGLAVMRPYLNRAHAGLNADLADELQFLDQPNTVSKLNELSTLVENDFLPSVFSKVFAKDQLEEVAKSFFQSMELVRFEGGILAEGYGTQAGVLQSIADPERVLRTQLRENDVFRYGWSCENVLFTGRQSFHYLYLNPAGSGRSNYRWALCLWTNPDAVQWISEGIGRDIEERAKRVWARLTRPTAATKSGAGANNDRKELERLDSEFQTIFATHLTPLSNWGDGREYMQARALHDKFKTSRDIERKTNVLNDVKQLAAKGIVPQSWPFTTLSATLDHETSVPA